MADLTNTEKRQFERLLGMGRGDVLDFSNRTFEEFVIDSTGRDPYHTKYDHGSSKANRLRGFWAVEPNRVVGKLMGDMLEYSRTTDEGDENPALRAQCERTVARLVQEYSVQELDALVAIGNERDFEVVAKAVRDAIDRGEPEASLDRLHTFIIKYVRSLCETRGISVARDKPLHSLFGEYVKHLKQGGHFESKMTERILKSSISTLEAFNDVRNNLSLAHDNPILGYEEALLIFNHVAASVRFLRSIHTTTRQREHAATADDDIPF